jgi:hypothetical protein
VTRPSTVEKGGSGVVPDYDTTKHVNAQKAKRSGQAKRSGEGGSGVSSGYGNPAHMHAEDGQAKRSGQAGRSEEGGLGGLSRLRHNTARPCAEESQDQRPGRAQRKNGVRGSPPCYDSTQNAHAQMKAERMRPGRSQRRKKFGDLSRLRQSSSYARRRRPS